MPLADWLKCACVAVQAGVALYALRLNKLFGSKRAGWPLLGAFILMAAMYASQFWDTAPTAPPSSPAVASELVYLFISVLLLAGLSQVREAFAERRRAETALVEARRQLERAASGRAAEQAKADASLANEAEERRRLQTQLARSQKLETLGQLATGTAHYFKNILVAAEGHLQPLIEDQNQREATVQRLTQVRAAARRATGLTRQLMTFTREQAMRREVLDLDEVINHLTPALRLTLGQEIVLRIEKGAPPLLIYADAAMMEQILVNLTLNARDAMPRGGQLSIEAARATIGDEYEKQHLDARGGEFVRLTVTDTGCGMPPEIMERVFEPFFTTKGSGKSAGLGLATIYGIVAQHGGWIQVSSAPDQGATFDIFLPSASQVPQ